MREQLDVYILRTNSCSNHRRTSENSVTKHDDSSSRRTSRLQRVYTASREKPQMAYRGEAT